MSRLEFVHSKIVSLETAILKVNAWKMKGDQIAFTNGCFDILHKGHVTYLAKAADFGDRLVVALNTDNSVKRLKKGDNRPINNELARETVLASLAFVDLVVLFDEETPIKIIESLEPNILLKGADYDANETNSSSKKYIVGSDFVRKNGGQVVVVDLEEGYSTTGIIEKMKS